MRFNPLGIRVRLNPLVCGREGALESPRTIPDLLAHRLPVDWLTGALVDWYAAHGVWCVLLVCPMLFSDNPRVGLFVQALAFFIFMMCAQSFPDFVVDIAEECDSLLLSRDSGISLGARRGGVVR